jgi:hypothetical protein
MGFKFGAFAGGLAGGLEIGMRAGKNIRDVIRENKLQDLREQGMQEANAARTAAVNGMVTTEPPAPAPVEQPAQPTQTTQAAAEPAAAAASPAPSPTESPDAASAKTAASAMAPAAKTFTPRWEGDTGPGPNDAEYEARAKARDQGAAVAQPTPQTAAAGGIPGAQPATPEKPVKVEGKFFVNGKGYATREEANKAAEAAVPSTMEFFMKNTVPKLQEAYVAQGDPAKAEAWGTWAANKQNQQSMVEWSKMYRAAQMGDMEKAADHAFNLYKKMDDGITPVSKETVKDKEGNVTGFNVRLKNDSTGEVTSQFIDKKGLIEMGLAGLAPDKLFEMTFKRQMEADKAAMDARIKRGERVEKVQDQLVVEEYKENRADRRATKAGQQRLSEITLTKQLESENMGAKERAQAKVKMDMLREAGYTDEQISGMVPAIIGAGEHKKTTDPAERRALIASDLVKNDPTFSRLPVAERNQKVDDMMSVIYGDQKAPGARGGQAPGAAAPGQQDFYVRDTKTGQVFIKRGTQFIPVNPAAGPAAGMPAR